MSDEAQTKPTIETVLQRIDDFRNSVDQRLDRIEKRLEDFDIRLDSIEGEVNKTRSQMFYLSVEFKETRKGVNELDKDLRAHLNQFNQPA